MKNLIIKILLAIVLIVMVLVLTGCTLTLETTDNSVSASVDGDTTERVDSIIDWMKDRLGRFFGTTSTKTTTETAPIGNGNGEIL